MSTQLSPAGRADPRTIWTDYTATPLLDLPALARTFGVQRVQVKDEGQRPLGHFKVLGGMVAGLQALQRTGASRLLCASAGNHGLAVAAAAARSGAEARIFVSERAAEHRVARLLALGAEVVRVPGTYDGAVLAAAEAAARGEGVLIPDTSPDTHDATVLDVMAGYSLITDELRAQLCSSSAAAQPTHVIVQAGVGGLAAAVVDGLAGFLPKSARFIVAEPAAAACVVAGLNAGRPVRVDGELTTCAEMLACGLASASAIATLLRHQASGVPVSGVALDEPTLARAPLMLLDAGGPRTTPSGSAGLAALLHIASNHGLRAEHGLTPTSQVLLLVTERE